MGVQVCTIDTWQPAIPQNIKTIFSLYLAFFEINIFDQGSEPGPDTTRIIYNNHSMPGSVE